MYPLQRLLRRDAEPPAARGVRFHLATRLLRASRFLDSVLARATLALLLGEIRVVVVARALLVVFSRVGALPLLPLVLRVAIAEGQAINQVEEDVANFLLVRGDYAYLGNGWTKCSHGYELPPLLRQDFGAPLARAAEVAPGVFRREWTKATVQMDCNTYIPTITTKGAGALVV